MKKLLFVALLLAALALPVPVSADNGEDHGTENSSAHNEGAPDETMEATTTTEATAETNQEATDIAAQNTAAATTEDGSNLLVRGVMFGGIVLILGGTVYIVRKRKG